MKAVNADLTSDGRIRTWKTLSLTARQAARKSAAKDGYLDRPMTTRSPYHPNMHHIVTVVRATKNCSRHVTLTLDNGRQMIVDDIWRLTSS